MSSHSDEYNDGLSERKQRLRDIMASKGLDIDLVASALGKSSRTITRYVSERDSSSPSEAELYALEEMTKCLRKEDSALQKEVVLGVADASELRGMEDPRDRLKTTGLHVNPEWAVMRIRELEQRVDRLNAQVDALKDTIVRITASKVEARVGFPTTAEKEEADEEAG